MHDVVVVGGSAGALDGIVKLVQGFPDSLKASVHVVMHSPESGLAFIPDILQGRTGLRVRVAATGDSIRHGVVYVPPPDHHLMLRRGRMLVNRGPKQNRFRPSIDALFTSAATAYGPRVVGILLSGFLDDGVHGLQQIRRHGGKAIVQAPEDAEVPILPLNAIQAASVDHVLPTARMSAFVDELTRTPARKPGARSSRKSADSKEIDVITAGPTKIPKAPPSPFTCPECDGALWQTHDLPPMYTCHVGHRFSGAALLAGQKEMGDQHLWRAVRSLEEQSEMHRRWAAPKEMPTARAADFRRHADVLEQRALVLRRILIERTPGGRPPVTRGSRKRRSEASR